jgi:hypothetical protein
MNNLDNFEARVFGTIRQNIEDLITVKELYDLGYLTERGVNIKEGLFNDNSFPIKGLDIDELIAWGKKRGAYDEMSGQLEKFVYGEYKGPLALGTQGPVTIRTIYDIIATTSLKVRNVPMKLIEKAYWLLVADYIAYSGNEITLDKS